MNPNWHYSSLGDAVIICDSLRKPINAHERNQRILGKPQDSLFPYYGATGQVGYIDGYLTDGEYVLLGEDGAPFLDAYASKAYLIQGKSWVNNHAHILKSKSDNRFLCYYLNYFNYKNYVTGTTRLKLTQAEMKKIPVPCPSLTEQQRIVAKIEELFSELDNSVAALKQTKAQLSVYRQAVLKDAFDGTLIKRKKFGKDSNDEWNTASITEFIDRGKHSLKAGPFGSSLKKEFYTAHGYKVYGQEQVISGNENIGDYYISQDKYQELISCKVKPNDILISLVGTVGKVLVLSKEAKAGIINPRLIKISLDSEKMLPLFFKYYFESDYLKKQYVHMTHGATMDVLNLSMIKKLPFPIYSIEDQKIIIREIESRMSACDHVENTIKTTLQQAESLRQSILKQAFEGKLV